LYRPLAEVNEATASQLSTCHCTMVMYMLCMYTIHNKQIKGEKSTY